MFTLVRLFGITLLALAMIACTPMLSSIGRERGAPANLEELRHFESLIEQRKHTITTLRALYSVRIERDGHHESLRYAVNADAEGRLRLEVLPTSAGFALGALVVSHNSFTMLDAARREAVVGTDGREALSRMLGISLTSHEVFAILSGALPGDRELAVWRRPEGMEGWYVEGGAGRFSALVSSGGEPQTLVFTDQFQEREAVVVSYEGWRAFGTSDEAGESRRIPERLTVSLPEHNVRVSLTARALATNIPIRDELFTLVVPSAYLLKRSEASSR